MPTIHWGSLIVGIVLALIAQQVLVRANGARR